MLKKVMILACFYQDLPMVRPQLVFDYFKQHYETKLITADFCHALKNYDNTDIENVIKVHVPKYNKNFSIRRIWSHIVFANKVQKIIKRYKPNILYICMPPNIAAMKSVNTGIKVGSKCIVDVIDIWPNYNNQSECIKGRLFKIWGSYRDQAIEKADVTILECQLYSDYLELNDSKTIVIPLAKKKEKSKNMTKRNISNDVLSFAYLGAFSNSYDFDSLITIMKRLTKWKPHLELIGRGDQKAEVLRKLDNNNIDYNDNGAVFDEEIKEKIFSKCHFGYNGFIKTAIVGQSYKSIDYLSYGIPLLNSLGADTWWVVDKYKIGLNFDADILSEIVSKIDSLDISEINQMKNNARAVFSDLYSWENYCKKMDLVLKMLGEENE